MHNSPVVGKLFALQRKLYACYGRIVVGTGACIHSFTLYALDEYTYTLQRWV